jgi:ABC-type transport system involved in multi-copper enzyme maturation permease subunit
MIARKTWREIRGMAFAYTLILELLLLPAVLLWPNLRRGGNVIVEMMPAEFLRDMMREVMSTDSDAAYRAYMAVQMFFKGVNMVGIAAAVLLGTGLIARERENQTLEFLLARPVSRSRILWDKFWVVAVAVAIPIFVTSWTAAPLSRLPSVDETLPLGPVTLCAMHNTAFVWAVLALTTLFSVMARSQVQVAFWIGAVIIANVAVYFVQEIRVASLFRLSDFETYGPIMAGQHGFEQVFWPKTVWLLLATSIVYAVADRLFRRTPL